MQVIRKNCPTGFCPLMRHGMYSLIFKNAYSTFIIKPFYH